jgi:two-component system chemotaxis sensor kinase CheA
MSIQDDETLQMYLEESIDHLSDIENDLLAIEADGANINEDLVNKVYRAAHSIKGGAGFMGLTNIKDLTHEMENILGKIRSREMVPTPAIVNVLLKASDALKELLDNVLHSNEMDISGHVSALQAILETGDAPPVQAQAPVAEPAPQPAVSETATAPPAPEPTVCDEEQVSLAFPGSDLALTVSRDKVTALFDQSKSLYLVKMDIAADIQAAGKTCQGVIEEMEQTGAIIGTNFSLQSASELDKDWTPDVPTIAVLFGSILKPGDINVLFEVGEHQILELKSDLQLYRLNGDPVAAGPPAEEPAPEPPAETPEAAAPVQASAETAVPPAPETAEPETPAPPIPEPVVELQAAPVALQPLMESGSVKKSGKVEHETSLRVHVSLLDQLMTLAGELVLSRNQLLQSITSGDHRGSETAGQRIDLITSELQEAIMLTRMQSIGNVFNKFPRVVRDLAQTLGKQIELTLEGKDVELDKTIIEAIGDPLTHLVRNSVDHGIEAPSIRQQAGKNPTGQIYLKAYHEA